MALSSCSACASQTTEPERRTDDRASLVNVIFTTRGYVGIGVGTLRAEKPVAKTASLRAPAARALEAPQEVADVADAAFRAHYA